MLPSEKPISTSLIPSQQEILYLRHSSLPLPGSLRVPPLLKSWRIADYQDTIVVVRTAPPLVHERITWSSSASGMAFTARFPMEYPGPSGTNYTLYLKVIGVTDDTGDKLKYESQDFQWLSRPEDLHPQRGRHHHTVDIDTGSATDRDTSQTTMSFTGM